MQADLQPLGSRWNPAAAALMLSLCLGVPPSVATCPPCCLCASDIISCSGSNLSTLPSDLPGYATRLDLSHNALTVLPVDWISRPLDRLATLILSRNSISRIEEDAFTVTPHLLLLDLSSNRLTALNTSIFAGLEELKELLLFGNHIVHINPGAFSDVYSLKRLYLSGNRLTAFPLGLYWEPGGPRNLTFLDLSSNRLSEVPVQRLLSLTRHGSIYLHENPLVCDCALLALLEYWMWKQYRPLVDFRGEYPCRDGSGPVSECSQEAVSDKPLEAQTYQVEPEKDLRVPCPGLASHGQEAVFWVTPGAVVNSSTNDPSAHLIVSPNGTLEIQGALMEDSGIYGCVAARGRHYDPFESLEINVVVGNLSTSSASGLARGSGAEHFNTAFTTLASCVVSIILVLLYLYLTPCRCRGNRGGGSRGCGGRAFILCSDPREVESGHRRSNGKRVAFLEPQAEDCDIGGSKAPAMNLGHVTTEGILKNGSRTVGQSLTATAQIA
ncbi:Amphoterin-induced protein 2 [Liparis tanakae]|uniref:Amphoterin-induced protein 2 n=1 Tax=Liparis tanakae TaxID=230148 RepID=A0A4Z2GSA5_9TELE|nr:Amphoterin-induced protein 2 [Liparis tanakae]